MLIKKSKFNRICGTIKRMLKGKIRRDTLLKFYEVMAAYEVTRGLYDSEILNTENKKRYTPEHRLMK